MKPGLKSVTALLCVLMLLGTAAPAFAEHAVIIQEPAATAAPPYATAAPAATTAPAGSGAVILTPATLIPAATPVPTANPVPVQTCAPQAAAAPASSAPFDGYALIRSTGDAGKITLPKQSCYLSAPEMMYVRAGGKNSNYSYLTPWKDKKNLGPYPYHGMRVTVVARMDGYSCIVFHDHLNRLHASWVDSRGLCHEYPGVEQTMGERRYFTGYDIADPEVTWSRDSFTGSKQKYTILSQAQRGVTQFTLDYHVIARNGAQTQAVLGDRRLYIHDGTGWTELGTFAYPEIDATHVVVNLSVPTNLVAVATTADCDAPDTFRFRQTVLDVVVQQEGAAAGYGK